MRRRVGLVLVDHPALHHESDAAHGGDVFQWITIKRNEVGLESRCEGAERMLTDLRDALRPLRKARGFWAPGDPPGLEDRVRKTLANIDPNLVLYGVDPYTKVVSADFQQEEMISTLTALFGLLGLVLAAVGLYGVMAYTVQQRTGEIGVRMALGADRARVLKMILRGAFSQIGIGMAIGIPAAVGAGKLMSDQLFGVKPWNPVRLALAVLMLALAALLASLIPARRAAGVEPVVALRNE